MRNAVITVVFLVMMLFDSAVLQKDCIFEGRINIRSRTGEPKGWMKKDLPLSTSALSAAVLRFTPPAQLNVFEFYI